MVQIAPNMLIEHRR